MIYKENGMVGKLFKKFKNMSDNNKIVLKNVIGAFAVKGLCLVVSLFTMPAYISFFNNDTTLGLWFTILSVLTWILNFDLGIGNGLRNHLTKTITQKNDEDTKKYISSAYISIGIVCVALVCVFLAVCNFINWNKFFNIESSIVSGKAMLTAVKIVFIGIILQLFFKLINSILYALQKSSVNNFLHLCTTVLGLICVLIIPSGDNDINIIVMAVVHLLAVIVPLLVTTIIVFLGKTLRNCLPSVKAFSKKHAKEVLFLGSTFLFLQLAQMVVMATNEYLITYFHSNEAVVDYNIYHKLAVLGSTVFSLALTPVWSAVTKALTEKNYNWVDMLYKRFMLLGTGGFLLQFLMIPFYQIIINLWLGSDAINVNYFHVFSFAVLGGAIIYNTILFNITSGIGDLKLQTTLYVVAAIIKIPIAWILVKLTGSWIGVVWANNISLGIYCMIQPIWMKKYLNKKKKEVEQNVIVQE